MSIAVVEPASASPVPLVVAESLRPLLAFRDRVGEGRPSGRSVLPVGPLPIEYAGRLFADAARALGSDDVGLRVGAATRFEDSPLGLVASRALTVGQALAAASRQSARFCAGQRLWLTHRGHEVWLSRRFDEAPRVGRRQANDFALQLLLDTIRRGAGPDWRPRELRLESPPPPHAGALAALASGETHFEATADTLVFSRDVLALPLGATRRTTAAVPPLPALDFAGSVRRTVRFLLDLDELTLANVAAAAATSPRSLQRRLGAQGLRFGRLVEEARFESALRLLADGEMRITDVAAQLGYHDSANFTRAFRRWSGESPLAYRRARWRVAVDAVRP